jgi:hypothetical protein
MRWLFGCLLLCWSASAFSCKYPDGLPDYMRLPWPERLRYYQDGADVIFRGTVASQDKFDAQIKVFKIWRGSIAPVIEYRQGTSCDADLWLGEEAIFFGRLTNGRLTLSGLTGKAPVEIEKYLGPPLRTFDQRTITIK